MAGVNAVRGAQHARKGAVGQETYAACSHLPQDLRLRTALSSCQLDTTVQLLISQSQPISMDIFQYFLFLPFCSCTICQM